MEHEMEPITNLLTGKLIEKLFDACIDKGRSAFQGGAEGRAIKEAAKKLSNGDDEKTVEFEKLLYDWCTSESFTHTIEAAKKGEALLDISSLRASLVSENVQVEQPEEVISVFLSAIKIHLSADDKTFAARNAADQYDSLFNEMSAMKQAFQQIQMQRELSEADETNIELRGQLNACKQLIDTGRVMAAHGILLGARRAATSSDYSKQSLSRIANLFGVCALRLSDMETAQKEFESACLLNPLDAKYFVNHASALVLLGRTEEAVDLSMKAISMSSTDLSITANHIMVLTAAGQHESIQQIIAADREPKVDGAGYTSKLENDGSCLIALGQFAISQNDDSGAVRFFEKGCDIEPDNPRLHYLLARALFLPTQRELLTNTPMDGALHPDQEVTLRRVTDALSKSLNLMKYYDYELNKVDTLINRAGVLNILNDRKGALADIERALELEPGNAFATINKARLLLTANENEAARICLESVPEKHITQVAKVLAEVYFRLGRHHESLKLLRLIWENHDGDPIALHLSERHIQLEHDLHGAEAANKQMGQVLERYGRVSDVLRIQSQESMRQGLKDLALNLMVEARAKARLPGKHWFSLELARLYKACGNADLTANSEYQDLCNQINDEQLWVEYICFLSDQRMFFAAYKRAEQLRDILNRPIQGITETVECGQLMAGGRFEEARDVMLLAQAAYPLRARDLANLALAHLYLNDLPSANDTASTIKLEHLEKQEFEFVVEVKRRVKGNITAR
jgi:tetratricopeptide (TPR) repeat protein